MWKKFNLSQKIAFLILVISFIFLLYFYLFNSISQIPFWMSGLLLSGIILLLLHFSLALGIKPFTLILLLTFIFHKNNLGFIFEKNFDLLFFFIQWAFFILGIEIGFKNPLVKNFIPKNLWRLGFITLTFLAAFFLFSYNFSQSLFLAFTCTVPTIFTNNEKNEEHLYIPYLIFSLFVGYSLGWEWSIYAILFLFTIIIVLSIYEIFLYQKISFPLFLFFISFMVAVFAYHYPLFPVFLTGIFIGRFFLSRHHYTLPPISRFYYYFLFLFFFSKIELNITDFLFAGFLLFIFIIIYWIKNKKLEKAIQLASSIEFPLSLFIVGVVFNLSNLLLVVAFLSVILLSFLEHSTGTISLLRAIRIARKHKKTIREDTEKAV